MYCGRCGKELKSEVRFCPYCGAKIEHAPAPSADENVVPPHAAPLRLTGLNIALAAVIVLCIGSIAFMDKIEAFFGKASGAPVSSVVSAAHSQSPEPLVAGTPAPIETAAPTTPAPAAAPTAAPAPMPIRQNEMDGPEVVLKAALEVSADSPWPDIGARYIGRSEAEELFEPHFAIAREADSIEFALECTVHGQKMRYGFVYSKGNGRGLTRILALKAQGQAFEKAFEQEIDGPSYKEDRWNESLQLAVFEDHIVVSWREPGDTEAGGKCYVSLSSSRVEGYLNHFGSSDAFCSDQNCYILRDGKWFWLKPDGKGYGGSGSSGFLLEWVDPSAYRELYGEDDVTLDFKEFDTVGWYSNPWLDGKEIGRKEFVHAGKRTYVWRNKVVVRRGAKIFVISSKEEALGDSTGGSGSFFIRPAGQSPRAAEGYDAGEKLPYEYHPGFMLLDTAKEANIRMCFDFTPSGDAKYINFEMID